LDNDSGFSSIESKLKALDSVTTYPATLKKDDYAKADFIHVIHNLYIVLTPLNAKNEPTDIESLFDDAIRLKQHNGKCFNTIDKRDEKVDLSKDAFANHIINAQKNTLNFDTLKPLLDRVVAAISHYDSIKQN
jgi:RNA-directed DNA polymerase